MASLRVLRHPVLVTTGAVAAAAILAAVILRIWAVTLFDGHSGVPARYSTAATGLDRFEVINLVSAAGLVAIVVALVALVIGVVVALRIARAS